MDYENLYKVLPKYPQMWSIQDVSLWLEFVNLEKYITAFEQASVDGSCINLIDDEILKEQLGIQSGIIRKKLLNWTQIGLQQYTNFLESNSNKMIDESDEIPFLAKTQTSKMRESSKSHSSIAYETTNDVHNNEDWMIIESHEGNNLGTHIIKNNQRISVGYEKSNDIQSLESTFSDRHAMIGHNGLNFFVMDLGSKYGTFIKIMNRTILSLGMILQIGSFQFQVATIDRANLKIILKCIHGDLSEEQSENLEINNLIKNRQLIISMKESNKFTFGRRKDNNFHRNDKHMSGLHCKITHFNNNFYIEDFGSTNGTWMRISGENKISKQISIENGFIIKIGATVTYLCRGNQKSKQTVALDSIQSICRMCNKQQNNCLFYPCSHNIVCLGCSQNFSACSQCGQHISQKIKIHK